MACFNLNGIELDTTLSIEIDEQNDIPLTVDVVYCDGLPPRRYEHITEVHWRFPDSNFGPQVAIESDILSTGVVVLLSKIAYMGIRSSNTPTVKMSKADGQGR